MTKKDLDNTIISGIILSELSSLWSLKLRLEKSFKKDHKNPKIKNLLHKANEDIKKLEKKLSLINKKLNKTTDLERLAQETQQIYKKGDEAFLKGFCLKPKSQKTK